MGVEPLPADLRKPCDCTGGSEKTWQGPQKRIWIRFPLASPAIYPGLALGTLAEIVEGDITIQNCKWRPASTVLPVTKVTLTRIGQSPSTGTGFDWNVEIKGVGGQEWIGNQVLPAASTPQDAQILASVDDFTPELGVICDLTQVRWFEDADDVPH